MKMEMLVRVDVIEREAGCAVGFELGFDLGAELPPYLSPQRDVETEPRHVGAEISFRIDQTRHAVGRQHGRAFDQHDMQADAQPRQLPRARDRVLGGGTCHHEACGGEDAVLMRDLDGLVDLGREPEIVGGDDQLFHANRMDSPSSCPALCRASTSSFPLKTWMAGTSPAMTMWRVFVKAIVFQCAGSRRSR